MNLRLKITLFLILISLLGVTGSTLFVLQNATADKKNYVTELNSVLSPEIQASVDQKNQTLLALVTELAAVMNGPAKSFSLTNYLNQVKQRLPEVKALFIYNKSGQLIALPVNDETADPQKLSSLSKDIQDFNSSLLNENQLFFLKDQLYVFKATGSIQGAALLKNEYFANSFELARGKSSLLITGENHVLFSNSAIDANFIQNLPTASMRGAEIFAIELKDQQNKSIAANFSKLKSMKETYVVILSPQATWQDLASPLLKSSISLILVLVLFSVLFAYSISRSLTKPIERLASEAARVGLGDWQLVTIDQVHNETSKLAEAFNRMIGNLKIREQELKIANQKLVHSESLSAVGRMAAGIAHEVKNPLSSILGYAQLIEMNLKTLSQQGATPSAEILEKYKNYNQMVMDDTRRANKIISSLLTFSRQKEIVTETVTLFDFIHKVEPKFKALCDLSSITLSSNADQISKQYAVNIDPDQIYQVLYNLVQNAVHALNSTEKTNKTLQFNYEVQQNHVMIHIIDNGPGISPEHISKIFEPFFSTKKMGEGSGLGLAICYGIILQHNGLIQVESTVGHSTCFKVKLPLISA